MMATVKCVGRLSWCVLVTALSMLKRGFNMAFRSMKDDNDYGHPSTDDSTRFPEDQLLRDHGFEIQSRPKEGEAWWYYKGGDHCLYPHSEALAVVRGK